VTPAAVQAAAVKYWNPTMLQIVAVGDEGKVVEVLRKKGAVEIYDLEGKLVKGS
jgi:hypothetical protein